MANKEKSTFKLVVEFLLEIVRFVFKKSDAKDKKIKEAKKELEGIFNEKDKDIRTSKLNSFIQRINRM